LPSSGSLLRNNPILSAPAEPHGTEEQKLQGNRPAPAGTPTDNEARVHVTRIEVDNVPKSLQAQVAAVVTPYRDREMTLTDVRNVAIQVTEVLLDNGESISYAYVPPQDMVDGVVRLNILRGRVEAIELQHNRSLVHTSALQAYLDRGVTPSGDIHAAQDQLTRMSDLPGLGAINSTLSPGKTPGGTVLSVDAEAGPRIEGVLVTDNAGSRLSGRNRAGAQVGINSPLGFVDRLQAVFYGAPDALQLNHDSDGGQTLIGRVSYDRPIGARGARLGLSVSRVDYTLGGLYQDLGEGYATVYSVYGSYPLARAQSYNLDLNGNLDYKRMSDSLLDSPNRRSAPALAVQLAGDGRSQLAGLPNVLQYQIGVSRGDLHNDADWNGAQTRGRFLKAMQYAKLQQGLGRGLHLDLSINAQQASRNLDGAEKMVLGGPNAVRAYSNDTASADSVYVASLALNMSVPKLKGVTALVFYDRARATVQKFVRRGANAVSMDGYGFGLQLSIHNRASVNLSYAIRRGSDPLLGKQHRSVLWASAVVRF
jgi:hemolysin activation/secretion protein